MKLHLGCGTNVKAGYINIDAFVKGEGIQNLNVLNLPFEDGSVTEILSEHMFEHLPFKDESIIFRECHRLLKKTGKLIIEVPDMYWACKQFVEGKDNFKEFYLVGSKDHYFGNGRATDQRWGILTTFIFGNQNGDGQFHYNGYTEEKLLRIADILGFSSCNVEKTFNKGGQVLVAIFIK